MYCNHSCDTQCCVDVLFLFPVKVIVVYIYIYMLHGLEVVGVDCRCIPRSNAREIIRGDLHAVQYTTDRLVANMLYS